MAERQEMDDAAVLDLDQLVNRRTIIIKGEHHEILSPGELSALDSQRLAAWGRKYDKLINADSLNEVQKARLGQLINRMANLIMAPVPDGIRDGLTQGQKLSVIEVFTGLLLRSKMKAAGGIQAKAPANTGASAPPHAPIGAN